jgi:hypothetical protein
MEWMKTNVAWLIYNERAKISEQIGEHLSCV